MKTQSTPQGAPAQVRTRWNRPITAMPAAMPARITAIVLGCLATVCAIAPSAQAVVVHGRAMERPDNAFIGIWGGGTGVAVGPNHFLSARHVRGRAGMSFRMDGEFFKAVSTITHPVADLMLIEVDRELPGWHEIADDVSRRDRVILGGFGRVKGDRVRKGYKWSRRRGERWGENIVDRVGRGQFTTRFTRGRRALKHEATLAPGDSGGGAFIEGDNGELLLAGLNLAVDGPRGRSRFGSRAYLLNLTRFESFFDRVDVSEGPFAGFRAGSNIPAPSAAGALVLGVLTYGVRRRRR